MRIGAVIVSYNPENSLKNIINILKKWGIETNIVIVDNNSKPTIKEKLKSLSQKKNVQCIFNSKNLGIGQALNIGIESLKEKCEWVLTFDQDSIPDEQMLDEMKKILINSKDQFVKSIAPIYKQHDKIYSKDYIYKTNVITSGNLIEVKTWEDIGKFRENWFIDAIDTEYCLRLRKNGYKILQSLKAKLYHNLGVEDTINLCGYRKKIKVHSPLRRYYIVRNQIYLIQDYYKDFPIFIMNRTIIILFFIMRILFLEKDKKNNFYHICKGIRDGFKRNEKEY
jgi:rhamnosyltransferase